MVVNLRYNIAEAPRVRTLPLQSRPELGGIDTIEALTAFEVDTRFEEINDQDIFNIYRWMSAEINLQHTAGLIVD